MINHRIVMRGLARRAAALAATGCAAVLWLLPGSLAAATLQDIEFVTLPGDKTEIRMQFDSPPPQPTGYTIEQPARIALDLADTGSALESKYHTLGIGNARSVTVMEAADRTRVIVNLTTLVPYSANVSGNRLTVVVGDEGGTTLSSPTIAARAAASGADQGTRVTDVDFQRGELGDARIVVTMSDDRAGVDLSSESGALRVQISDAALPDSLRRRLDVTDFATPVQTIDVLSEDDDTILVVRSTGDHEHLAYQADNVLTVNVKPIIDEAQRSNLDAEFLYDGEKLSLNFQDIEVRSALSIIANFTDKNLVASDTVSGRITLRLKNVPWDQALDIILKTKGLDKRLVGNVLSVAPADELAAREKLELENRKQIAELAPLRTEFIQVKYAKASELSTLFSAGETSMLSDRGSIIVDERTNSIILTDTTDKLAEIRRVMDQLDIPVRQVLIEARIATANTSVNEQLGIRWGGAYLGTANSGNESRFAGGSLDTLTEVGGTDGGAGSATFPGALFVDLGVSGEGASSFAVGIARTDEYIIDLELSALESDGQAEVVARPKVITADKQTAQILSGVQIPFQEASSSGATTTSFKDAVLSLDVTPQITPDDRIILDLQVNQDTVGAVFNGVPSINTNQITTQVLVDNGSTVVLGGIYQITQSSSETKTPFLGDIPYVGRLFKRTTQSEDKSELLIFVTPRLIDENLTAR